MKKREERARKNRARRFLSIFLLVLLIPLTAVTAFLAGLSVYLARTVDLHTDEEQFRLAKYAGVTHFYYNAAEGEDEYLPTLWEGESLQGEERREWTDFDEIPELLKNAFVAIEDKRFWDHDGVDWRRTVKAVANYIFKFQGTFGGSTLTQQVVKNLSGEKEKTPMRKVREIYRALSLEKTHSKREILEMYLNLVPLGRNIVGVGMGAKVYFGKDASALSLGEAAALAAITNSPVRYDLYRNPEENEKRRRLILTQMHEEGMISEEERQAAEKEIVVPIPFEGNVQRVHSWYIDHVVEALISDLMTAKGLNRVEASRLVYNGGLDIYTCADKRVQDTMEAYFAKEDVFRKDLHYAMTVLSARTGDLIGIVGREGIKEGNRLLNYASSVRRPPGSTIKPLSLYAPALEEGYIHYGTVLDDVPTVFRKNGDTYRPWPRNFPMGYQGLCDMKTAVAYSKNTVAVRIYDMLGAEKAYDYLVNRMHVAGLVRHAQNEAGEIVSDLGAAPLALGQLSYGVSLLDMSAAYGIFTSGEYRTPRSYLQVYDNQGKLLLSKNQNVEIVLSRENAYIMTKLLEGVTDFGTASSISLPDLVATAGKTGTSSLDKDRWFVGYTPDYVAGIWCGTNEKNGVVGEAAPSHLAAWDSVMTSIYRQSRGVSLQKEFPTVYGVYACPYCKDSGNLPTEECWCDPREHRVSIGYFTSENRPTSPCERHVGMLYDEVGGGVVIDGQSAGVPRRISLVRVEERSFPIQIAVRDAEYVYRPLGDVRPKGGLWKAFFTDSLPKNVYVGLSPTANGRQFNALSDFYGKEEEEKETEDETEPETED